MLDGNSDAGTDSQHPAGTSLADMVKIIWSDPYWIVKNGYKSYSGEDAYYGYKGFPHANRVQRLEEFNKSTHLYMGHLFYIVPEEFQFDEGKQYTVILRLSDGKQVERSTLQFCHGENRRSLVQSGKAKTKDGSAVPENNNPRARGFRDSRSGVVRAGRGGSVIAYCCPHPLRPTGWASGH